MHAPAPVSLADAAAAEQTLLSPARLSSNLSSDDHKRFGLTEMPPASTWLDIPDALLFPGFLDHGPGEP